MPIYGSVSVFLCLVIFSGLSFLVYGITFFTSPKMRTEFKRFGLSQFGPFVACLEILGSLGLFIGIKINLFLVLASGGLALLMLMGVLVRVKSKDVFKDVIPALFFAGLNLYLFIVSFNQMP
jgi:uncharacterized membrane protein YphA (DoxX/SURF4 family)